MFPAAQYQHRFVDTIDSGSKTRLWVCVQARALQKNIRRTIRLVSSCFYSVNQVGPRHMINFQVTQFILPSWSHVSPQLLWSSFWHNFGVCLFFLRTWSYHGFRTSTNLLGFFFLNILLATLVKCLIYLSWTFLVDSCAQSQCNDIQ